MIDAFGQGILSLNWVAENRLWFGLLLVSILAFVVVAKERWLGLLMGVWIGLVIAGPIGCLGIGIWGIFFQGVTRGIGRVGNSGSSGSSGSSGNSEIEKGRTTESTPPLSR